MHDVLWSRVMRVAVMLLLLAEHSDASLRKVLHLSKMAIMSEFMRRELILHSDGKMSVFNCSGMVWIYLTTSTYTAGPSAEAN